MTTNPPPNRTTPRPPSNPIMRFLAAWWRGATRPIAIDEERTPFQQKVRRFLYWLPIVVPVICVVAVASLYVATTWRARHLAAQAMESVREQGFAKARLQAESAFNLRPGDPAAQRALLFFYSSVNDPKAIPMWEALKSNTTFTAEEAEPIARVVTWFGTDEQFESATKALAEAGEPAKAATWRSARFLRAGNLTKSIEEARLAVAKSDDPEQKLFLARLLAGRYGPVLLRITPPPGSEEDVAAAELFGLVDSLQETNLAGEATAIVLGKLPAPPELARKWAESALRSPSADNLALVAAADYMVRQAGGSVRAHYDKLAPVYAGAPVPRRAAFAQWLNANGLFDESLDIVSAEDAAADEAAFVGRADALAALQRWDALHSLTEGESKVARSLRLAVRASAARQLGKDDQAPQDLADAIRAGAAEGRLAQVLAIADKSGQQELADDVIIELCADPALAGKGLRHARERFGRRGQFASMQMAWEAALAASPDAPAVKDYGRRLKLLADEPVDPAETSAFVEEWPTDIDGRFTHALALLKQGRPAEAEAVFEHIDVVVSLLPPGDMAIVSAIMAANGKDLDSRAIRAAIDPALLETGERALLAN